MASVNDLLAAGRLIAIRKCPYFRKGIMSLVPHEAPGLGTVGVTKGLLLLYDPEWVAQRTEEEMAALYYHEWMHPMLDHFERRGDADPKVWNIAGDCYINDQGRNMGFTFPAGGMFPETFGLPPNLTTDEYYALLLKQSEDEREASAKKGRKPGDWKSGECGSGAGNPIEGEPDGEGENRSEAELGQIKAATAQAIKQHVEATQGRGHLPLGLDRWAEVSTAPPQVPWQTVLARALRAAVAYRPGAVDYSYRQISRRQGGVGFGVGRPVLPAFVRPVPRVAFVLDTSGSMGSDRLAAGLGECSSVLKAIGAEVTFLSCDAQVHAVGRVANPRDLTKLVKGGGGSSFVPAFDHIAAMRQRPEIAVFATDGDIAVPRVAPKGLRVIWLLIDAWNKASPTTAYGEHIVVSAR